MPIFCVEYESANTGDVCNAYVEAKNAETAAKRTREKRAVQVVRSVERLGKFIPKDKPAGKPAANVPTWVTQQGNVRRISTLKDRTLKALIRKFEGVDFGAGVLNALKAERDKRAA